MHIVSHLTLDIARFGSHLLFITEKRISSISSSESVCLEPIDRTLQEILQLLSQNV